MNLLADIAASAITPALALLPGRLDSPEARCMMLAIGLQESRLIARAQIVNGGGKGPARGLWQFERGGGVRGVLEHPATKAAAGAVCLARQVAPTPPAVWAALETDDVLAAAFARLLLLADPKPLPALGDSAGAWACYLRNWRPGKPKPDSWPAVYAQALGFMKDSA
jgi:hypothetical protein